MDMLGGAGPRTVFRGGVEKNVTYVQKKTDRFAVPNVLVTKPPLTFLQSWQATI